MKTNFKTLHELESHRPTRNLSLGWLAAFSIPFICAAILSIWSAALRAETEHEFSEGMSVTESDLDLGNSPSTSGQKLHSVQGAGLEKGSGKSPNPWKPITFSVYGTEYIGRKMSNGKRYDPSEWTVASNDYPLGTKLDLRTRDTIVNGVTVTDRMAKRFSGKRIDLSGSLWKILSRGKKPGLLKGEVRRVGK